MRSLMVAVGVALLLALASRRSLPAGNPPVGTEPGIPAETFSSCLPQPLQQFAGLIQAAAQEFGVPPAMLAALVWRESRGDPNASNFSSYRARELQAQQDAGTLNPGLQRALATGWTVDQLATSIGLAEVEGDTAWLDLQAHYPFAQLFDPQLNLRLAAKYLTRMHAQFPQWRDALAAYNAGPGRVSSGTAPASSYDVYAAEILQTYASITSCTGG